MNIHDFGVWVLVKKNVDGKYQNFWYQPKDMKQEYFKLHNATIIRDGVFVCKLRESNKNYLWIESIRSLHTALNTYDVYINAHDKSPDKRLNKVSEQLDKAIKDMNDIKIVIDFMKENK